MFPLGRLQATTRALHAIVEGDERVETLLARHSTSDWGDLSLDDKKENDFCIPHRLPLLSAYRLRTGVKIYVVTDADRSATTVFVPDEY